MANIEDIWKKLEKPKPCGMTRNLNSKENIIHEHFEHPSNNGFEHQERMSTRHGQIVSEQPSENLFDSTRLDEDELYDDQGLYDQEVQAINLNNHFSREFSLSRYDVNVRQVQNSVPDVRQVQNSVPDMRQVNVRQVQNSVPDVRQVQNSVPDVRQVNVRQVQNSVPDVRQVNVRQVQNSVPDVRQMNVRQVQNSVPDGSHGNEFDEDRYISPSDEYEDDFEESDHDENDIESEYHSRDNKVVSNSVSNAIYYQGEVSHTEDSGSGHVFCDCDDCINQTEAVDCQCENCVQAKERTMDVSVSPEIREGTIDASVSPQLRERTIEVSVSPELKEVMCYCEDCIIHWEDPNYLCMCVQCVCHRDNKLSNNHPKHTCNCSKCLRQTGLRANVCNCEKCHQSENVNGEAVWSHDLSDFKGQRSPPQGSSQEYESIDFKHYDEFQPQSEKSFDSGTENSYRSSRSKASYSDSSNRTKESNSDYCNRSKGSNSDFFLKSKGSNSDLLSEKLGNVQLNDSNEFEDDVYTTRHVLRYRDHNLFSHDNCSSSNLHEQHQCVQRSFEADENCTCERCRGAVSPRVSRHLVSSPIQVGITQLLEQQLQRTEGELRKKTGDYETEINDVRKENDKQHKLIQQSLSLTPDAKIEATMQHEITRLTSENLDLREVIDKQADQIRKLKKMLKVYAKRLKEGEAAEIQAELEREETKSVENVAQIKHRERNYMGMLEYRKEDENPLIKLLILDLKPRVASGYLPGLPAYLLFMCVRHTDYVNDDEKVRSFLTSTINGIKKVVKKHHDDMDRVTLWLANTCRFLHTLKQYSGEKQFQSENTTRQNEHCLRNFDLAEYRQVFSDLAVWIYQTLIKLLEATIQPSIVAAVLEHEAIAGLTGSKPSGLRGRTSSRTEDAPTEHSLDTFMKAMNMFVRVLTQHAVDPELVKQIVRQLYYFIGASALNNLLLRKDMCNWSKGMQIRYNISHLEQWLRDNKLQESGAGATLEPFVQASQLLQARKTDADVESVFEMCFKLTSPQIVKILNLYTPVDEFEERVPITFIRKIQQKLKERGRVETSLLMDLKFSYSVTFPFNPSNIALDSIEVPDQLHIGNLLTRS